MNRTEGPNHNEESLQTAVATIQTELEYIRQDQLEMKRSLQQVHERVFSTPVCASPGLCVLLQQQGNDREARLRALERRDAYVVGACAILSLAMPIMLRVVFKI